MSTRRHPDRGAGGPRVPADRRCSSSTWRGLRMLRSPTAGRLSLRQHSGHDVRRSTSVARP